MNQYKELNLAFDINTKAKRVESTDSLFFSYDINAIRVIAEITKDKQALDDDLSVKLVLQSSNFSGGHKEGFLIHLDSKTKDSKVTFDLPNEILSYQGYVRMDFYVNYENSSNDAAQAYMFELRKSQIDKSVNNFEFVYISDFEQAKKEVLEAQQEALKSIEGVSHELDTTINETRLKIEARPQELNADITQAKSDIASKVDSVESSKTQAQATISGYVEGVAKSQATAETNMSDSIQSVSDKQKEALNSIDTSVSDVQTKQAQANDSFTKAIQDVEQAKATAQSEIASQTDLSADVATAKESMSESVQDVENAADYEKQQIEAIRPKLEQDIAFVKENAETIKAKGFLEKPKLAWANSEDMSVDFTTVKPEKNLLEIDTSKKLNVNLKGWNNYYEYVNIDESNWGQTFTTMLYVDLTQSYGKGSVIGFAHLTNSKGAEYVQYANTTSVLEIGQKGYVFCTFKNERLCSDGSKPSRIYMVLRAKNGSETDLSNIFISNKSISKSKNITMYLTNEKFDKFNSFPKYIATSNIDSNDPKNFTTGRYTNEYIDYKLQQLTNAVVTTSGGA